MTSVNASAHHTYLKVYGDGPLTMVATKRKVSCIDTSVDTGHVVKPVAVRVIRSAERLHTADITHMVFQKRGEAQAEFMFTADSSGLVIAYKVPSLEVVRQTKVGGIVTAMRFVQSESLRTNINNNPVGHLVVAYQSVRSQMGDCKSRIVIWNPRVNELTHLVDIPSEVLCLKYAVEWHSPLRVGCQNGSVQAVDPGNVPLLQKTKYMDRSFEAPPNARAPKPMGTGTIVNSVDLGGAVDILKLVPRKRPDADEDDPTLLIAAALRSGEVYLLGEECHKLLKFSAGAPVTQLIHIDLHDLIISGTLGSQLRFFSIGEGRVQHERMLSGRITLIGPFLPSEGPHGLLIVGVSLREVRANSSAEVLLYDPVIAECAVRISHEGYDSTCVKWVPSLGQILIASLNGFISCWDTAGRLILRMEDKDYGSRASPASKLPQGYRHIGAGSLEVSRRSLDIGALPGC